MAQNQTSDRTNPDPITGAPGSHPVGTGLGAAAGGMAAGAAAGAVGGPIGAVAGAVIGAVVGGLGGKAAAEAINPSEEQAYWRDNYTGEPYYEAGRAYEDYAPAYDLGLYGRTQYGGSFDDTESRLASDWESRRERSGLSWDQAREPSRAAWERVDRKLSSTAGSGSPSGSGVSGMSAATTSAMVNDPSGSNYRSGSSSAEADLGMGMASSGSGSMDNDDVIDTLNDLLECCRDGEYGFRESAEHAEAPDLKTLLMRHSEECRTAGQELMERIRQLGGEVDEGGTAAGALHRGWVSVKGTLAGYSDRAMLEECERGEDAAVARYRKALKQSLPSELRQLVERQAAGAQRNHDEIKALRDKAKDRV
ncbi:MAG: PA2169 family four-helix-bundle protein [Pseudomonadota bacterium]